MRSLSSPSSSVSQSLGDGTPPRTPDSASSAPTGEIMPAVFVKASSLPAGSGTDSTSGVTTSPSTHIADMVVSVPVPAITDTNTPPLSHCSNHNNDDCLALIASLKTTIEVLEAELSLYRNTFKSSDVTRESVSYTTIYNKKANPVHLNNKFEVLNNSQDTHPNLIKPTINKISTNKALTNHKNTKKTIIRKSTNNHNRAHVPFKQLLLYGDSHSRQLGVLLSDAIEKSTTVTGFCYPSARLENVIPCNPPPPGSCCIIVAGANDVATGLSTNIYHRMEGYIVSLLRNSKVLVATLPFRHDLPASDPINDEINLVNAYIYELCSRYEGAEIIETNRIGREGFTSHGLHLSRRGKRRLSRMILAGIQTLSRVKRTSHSSPAAPSTQPCVHKFSTIDHKTRTPEDYNSVSTSEPLTLPYNSYAEAASRQPMPLQDLRASPLPAVLQGLPRTLTSGNISVQCNVPKNTNLMSHMKKS